MRKLSTNQIVLVSGIGLYLTGLGLILMGGYFFDGDVLTQEPVLKIMTLFPPIIIFTLTLIYASIFEELAFRSWVIEKKTWKYISLLLILFFVYSAFGNILATITSGVVLYFVFFRIKDKQVKVILSVVITSILFALIHYANFGGWGKWFAMIQLTGTSFILCYLGLRFGFVYAILGHFVNNLIVLIILTGFINQNYTGEFGDESYSAQISKVSLFEFHSGMNTQFHDKTILTGNITQIAESVAPFDNNTIYRSQVTNLNRFRLEANANEGHELDPQNLFEDFLAHTKLKTDTTYEIAYVLTILDTARFKNPAIAEIDSFHQISLEGITSSIRSMYEIPIVLKEGQHNYTTYLYIELWTGNRELIPGSGFQRLQERLLAEYAISIKADSTKTARIITIRE